MSEEAVKGYRELEAEVAQAERKVLELENRRRVYINAVSRQLGVPTDFVFVEEVAEFRPPER